MKKTTILFFSITFFSSFFSEYLLAQKCNFEINGKDEFTGKVRKLTKDRLKPEFFLELEKSEENYFFRLIFPYTGALDEGVPKGTEVLLKLSNEEVLKTYTLDDHIPSKQVYVNGFISSVIMNCKVSKDEISQLSKNSISKIRMTLGGKEFTIDISEGKGANIKNSANCILP
ncbi:MAG: hypothetical protein EPN85_03750 [Bacteroidetes bacterium]|nr:MAG: hypothetical protein EPN85_03750 [Bacteroidota bacterium]